MNTENLALALGALTTRRTFLQVTSLAGVGFIVGCSDSLGPSSGVTKPSFRRLSHE